MGQGFNLELPAVKTPKGLPALTTLKSILHMLQVLCTVLTICIVAPIIAAEIKYYGGSQAAPNWTLFVGLASLAVPIGLVVFPWVYDRSGKFRRLGKFCMKPRTNLIFTGFYTGFWATAGIAMTVHANDASNCNLDSELQKSDDSYAGTWSSQCTCGKVSAGFSWTTCILWLLSLACTLIIFFQEKQAIQKNLKQHEMNKQAVLQMQQQEQHHEEEDLYDEGPRGGYHQPTGYYEDEEGEDLGGMRPQSFEQARPLHSGTPPGHHASPFESPFDSPYDPPYEHQPAEPKRVSYGYQEPIQAQYAMPQNTPYDFSPEPTYAAQQQHAAQHTPTPPPQSFTPMPMPEPHLNNSHQHF